jgi:hypothetical protein
VAQYTHCSVLDGPAAVRISTVRALIEAANELERLEGANSR